MLELGRVARVKAPARRRLPRIQPARPTRSWPLDAEKTLVALEKRTGELRNLVAARQQFSPEAVRRHRQSLGLSATQYGRLLGVFMQTVYGWEKGRFRPKPELLRKWIGVTRMSQEQARARLGKNAVGL